MIAAILLLATVAQDAPAPEPEPEEIVVRATYGTTTMLFDRGSDGKLRNCRIMVSSGSTRRDTAACQATPVCYGKTADVVPECVPLAIRPDAIDERPPARTVPITDLPKLVQPKVVNPSLAGPIGKKEDSRDTTSQRVKLPPLPRSPTAEPVIRITNGSDPNASDR